MLNSDDMDLLTSKELAIEDPQKYAKTIFQYVIYIYQSNQYHLFLQSALTDLKKHILNYLLVIAELHEGISEKEKEYLAILFDDQNITSQINQSSFNIIMRYKDLQERIPQYMQEIKRFKNGREYIKILIDCITKIGINFSAIDEQFSEEEVDFVTKYNTLLTSELLGNFYIDNNYKEYLTELSKQFNGDTEEPAKDEPQVPVSVTPSGDVAITATKVKTTATTKKDANTNQRTVEEILKDFNELIGLTEVKQELYTLINFAKINKLRKARNLPTVDTSMHLVFSGNPGTGKTTVARLLAEVYGTLGLLSKRHFTEVSRSDLVAEYVGHTGPKTRKVAEKALGGILFIDEAYTLNSGSQEDFGKEAVAELLKYMEDHRDDLVVIVAGYFHEMHKFIDMNPGLKSRFNKFITFSDYTDQELLDILKMRLKKNKYQMSAELDNAILEYFKNIDKYKFGNARGVRNLFEKLLEQQANRLSTLKEVSSEQLQEITDTDFYNAIKFLKMNIC